MLFFFLLRVSSLVCVWIEIQMALCDDADTKIQKYDEIFHKLLLIESSCFFCVCVLLHAGRVTFISHHIAIPFEWIIKTFRIILYRKMERMKKKNWIYSCCFIYSRFAFWSYSLLKWKKKMLFISSSSDLNFRKFFHEGQPIKTFLGKSRTDENRNFEKKTKKPVAVSSS